MNPPSLLSPLYLKKAKKTNHVKWKIQTNIYNACLMKMEEKHGKE